MDTRGKRGDHPASRRSTEVPTDNGSAQIVELGTVGPPPRETGSTALLIAGLVVAFGLGALVAVQRPAPEAALTPAPINAGVIATPSATASATATPAPTAGSWVWEAYDLRGFEENAELRRIWGFGNRFVALVATPADGPNVTELHSLLLSTDGSAWTRAVLPAPGFEIEVGTVIDETLWLVGQASSDDGRRREAWGTVDGITWTRAAGLESMTSDAEAVGGIALLPAGWVALCVRRAAFNELPTLEVRRESTTDVWDVTEITLDMHERPGAFVGSGNSLAFLVRHTSDEGDAFFDIRHSVDGAAWSVAQTFRPGAEMMSLAVGSAGFVLVGEEPFSTAGSHPIGWRSPTGTAWDEVSMPIGNVPPGLATVGAFRVVATGSGYLAISQPNGMAWISTDGVGWAGFSVWPTSNGFLTDVATVGDTVVAIRDNPGRLGFLRGSLGGMR